MYDPLVDVEAYVKDFSDKPKVTLHLDRDLNDPRVPKGTVLQSFKKGEVLEEVPKIIVKRRTL